MNEAPDDPYRPPKATSDEITGGRVPRTRAMRAFDGCMLILLAVVPAKFLSGWTTSSVAHYFIAAGMTALWIKALLGVFSAWREKDAKVLRFSGLGLLLFLAVAIASLW